MRLAPETGPGNLFHGEAVTGAIIGLMTEIEEADMTNTQTSRIILVLLTTVPSRQGEVVQ